MSDVKKQFTYQLNLELNKQSLKDIQADLDKLQAEATSKLSQLNGKDNLTKQTKKELLNTLSSINEVKLALKNAFNADLGVTNVAKFNQELKKMDISKLYSQFNAFGSTGRAAFRDIAVQATSANLELKKTSKFIEKLGETMANSIRWSITSSAINSLTGSVEKAYGYIKKLDTSLNDIRIVSGQSANQMAELAVQANKAAQALGTTTTTYTDAALIYYQQGLSSSDVSKRTETTLKMANVLGESAQDVSSYMTAIWNNFEDGSKKLEYFGDVITALGASTASSAAEISKGLQHFAAVSQTVGLSYEYATSSLAAVVAATRQSADSVGTAFKTIFSRIQGLKLGETLDDGTTLNKYSNALLAAGVNIKDNNGELKTMDTILEEMAAKWETLNKDEQMALAQTVAGTRQYTYLISLMEKWEDVTKNIETAKNATGELNKQQEIYNESLRAKLNALQSAKDSLTTEFFDADSFKNVIDLLTKMTSGFSDFIKAIGGGGKAISALGVIFMTVMNKQIAQGINNTITNFKNWRYNIVQIGSALESIEKFRKEDLTGKEFYDIQEKTLRLTELLTDEERAQVTEQEKKLAELLKQKELLEDSINIAREFDTRQTGSTDIVNIEDIADNEDLVNGLAEANKNAQGVLSSIRQTKKASVELGKQLEKNANSSKTKEWQNSFKGTKENLLKLGAAFKKAEDGSNNLYNALIEQEQQELENATNKFEKEMQFIEEGSEKHKKSAKERIKAEEEYAEVVERIAKQVEERTGQTVDAISKPAEKNLNKIKEEAENTKKSIYSIYENAANISKIQLFTGWLTSVGGVSSSFSMLREQFKELKEDGEINIGALVTSLGFFATSISRLGQQTGVILANFKLIDSAILKEKGLLEALKFSAIGVKLALGGIAIALVALQFLPDIINWLNRSKREMENLVKASEAAKKAADDLKDSYNDLVISLKGFSENVNTLHELKQGTDEWNKALRETNENVLELIKKFPELKAAFKINESTGEYGFNIGMANDIMKDYYQKAGLSERAYYESENAISDKKISNLKNKKNDYINEYNELSKSSLFAEEGMQISYIDNLISSYDLLNKDFFDEKNGKYFFNTEKFKQNYEFKIAEQDAEIEKEQAKKNANNSLISRNYIESGMLSGYTPTIQNSIANKLNQKAEELSKNLFVDSIDYENYVKALYGKDAQLTGDSNVKVNGEEIKLGQKALEAGVKRYKIEQSDDFKKYANDLDTEYKDFQNKLAENKSLNNNSRDLITQLKYDLNNIDYSKYTTEDIEAAKDYYKKLNFERLNGESDQQYAKRVYYSQGRVLTDLDNQLIEEAKNERAKQEEIRLEAEYQNALEADAKSLDITKDALAIYTDFIIKNNKALENNKVLAEKVAKENAEFAKSYQNFTKIFGENFDLLKEWNNNSSLDNLFGNLDFNTAEVLGKVQQSLGEMFGSISLEDIKGNFNIITELFNGETKNIGQLKKNFAQSFWNGLFDSDSIEENLTSSFDTIDSFIKNLDFDNIEIGADINNQPFIDALNEMIDAGAITTDEVNELFDKIGYTPEFEENTVQTEVPPMGVQTGFTFETGNGDTGSGTLGITQSGTSSEYSVLSIMNEGVNKQPKHIKTAKAKTNTINLASSVKNTETGKSKKSQTDLNKDIADPYHDVDIQLKKISNDLSLIEKQQSKLFGGKLIENLNKQMDVLDKKMQKTNEKLGIANNELARLKGDLSAKGVTFNGDEISNYKSILEKYQKDLNNAIEKSNNNPDSDSLKQKVDDAKELYEELKKSIADYDSTLTDVIPKLKEDLQDAFNKEIEINIDKFNMSIKLQLDLSEAEKQWNKFSTRIIKGFKSDNKVGKAEETRDNLKVDYGNFSPLTDQVNEILDAYNKMQSGQANAYGNNKTALLDDLKKYGEELQNTLIEAKDYLEEINNLAVESLEDVAAAADKMNENFESVQSTLEHDIQLVKLISGEDNYDTLLKYYEQQTKVFENQVEMQKSNVDYWTAKMAELEEGGDEWQVASDNWKSAVDSLYSSLEIAIEALKNKLATQISSAFQSFEISTSGGDTLSYLNTEWDLVNKNADRYLDSVNAAYGIQKLENKLLKSMGDTNNVAAQKQLQNIYENELKTLKEMDKVSQYDIDRANKKYELTLKQIALQDAQQNKSKMRLRRDSSGNYSYQFVADDDKLSQLQDEIAEINNSIYNLDKNAYNQNLNEYVNAYQEMQNKITEISTNAALQDEEKERQILLVREQYAEIFKGIIEDNTKYQVNLADSAAIEVERLGSESYKTFQDIANEEGRIIMEELIPQWGTGIQSMISYLNGDEKGGGGLKGAWDTLFSHINSSLENYKKSIEALDSSSGGLLSTIKTGYDNNSSAILALNNNLSKQINLRKEEADAISKVKIAVDSLAASYKKAEESAKNAATAAHDVWNKEQQKAIQETKNTASALPTNTPTNTTATQSISSATTSTENTVKPKTWYRVITKDGVQLGSFENESNAANYKENGYRVYDKRGTNYYVQRSYSATGKTQGTNDSKTGNSYTAYEIKSSSGKTKYYMASSEAEAIKKAEAEGFDTGGYTGEWGSSGKLAMLHEKELVLNKEDTSNMLNIVNVVRAISDKFKSFTGNFANIFDGLSTTNNTDNSVEQNVYITANFEGATSADEIKNALSNLMNVASQKVHSTRR